MPSAHSVKLRPLEREDLRYVHQLDNNASVMRYWFEEPYEAFVELSDLYDKHIHDQSERRFVVECDGEKAGLVELVEINHVHRRAEFQIIISPEYQGKGLATRAAKLAMDYGFTVLNLYKLYLIVDKENEKAIHIYRKPIDAQKRGIANGDMVRVYNHRGEVRLPAKVTPRILPGVSAMGQGAWHEANMSGDKIDHGGCVNTLTTLRPSPLAKGNPQHTNLVEIEKI